MKNYWRLTAKQMARIDADPAVAAAISAYRAVFFDASAAARAAALSAYTAAYDETVARLFGGLK